jgi:sialate O-acetylesterase
MFGMVTGVAAETSEATELRLPSILSDHMVLQADKSARIWGWAHEGKTITVEIAGQKKQVDAGAEGRWQVMLDPMASGGPYEMSVNDSGTGALTVRDILVGDVWLCSGQSNMQFKVHESENAAAAIAEADIPEIRLFTTGFYAPEVPQEDLEGQWLVCRPETARAFSAVGYFFGKEIHQQLKIPVGLIHSSQGATAAEYWTPMDALRSDPELADIVHRYENMAKDPRGWDMHLPSGLYNGKIAPLTPLSMKGIIWYQGETNGKKGYQYRTLFPVLIQSWRKAWGEDLPFYFVQLANHYEARQKPVEEPWAELREAQSMALSLPDTGMAVAIDLGEAKNIHPKKKEPVGHRLALWALAKTYGKDVVFSGPLYDSNEKQGNAIRVKFKYIGGGLEAKGGTLQQFAIAGADQKWVWAEAVIDGDTVVVSSPQVSEPVAVRYAWANNPEGANLYNQEGLPASPFRTDDWPGVTDKKHVMSPEALAKKVTLPEPLPPLPDTVGLTGNTLEIEVGKEVKRTWDMIKVNGYEYVPEQRVKGAITTVYLPYGTRRGSYFEMEGMKATPVELGSVPALVMDGSGAGHLTYRFHFDRAISSFGLKVGYGRIQTGGGVLVFEYSTDGQSWTTFREVTQNGEVRGISDPKKHQVTELDTQDLYIRCALRPLENSSQKLTSPSLNIRMAGDVRWGDASRTFPQSQWQLELTVK